MKEGVIEYRACLRAWRKKNNINIDKYQKEIREEMEQRREKQVKRTSKWPAVAQLQQQRNIQEADESTSEEGRHLN